MPDNPGTLPPYDQDDFVKKVILAIDVKDSGEPSNMKFDFAQLMVYVEKENGGRPLLPSLVDEQRALFSTVDTDQDGYVTLAELKDAMAAGVVGDAPSEKEQSKKEEEDSAKDLVEESVSDKKDEDDSAEDPVEDSAPGKKD